MVGNAGQYGVEPAPGGPGSAPRPAPDGVGAVVELDRGEDSLVAGEALHKAPGPHRVAVSAESYVPQTSELELRPEERTVLRVGLVRARATLGLRINPGFVASFPLRTDTPFGSYTAGIALQLFHDAARFRALRFGLDVEYHAQRLNAVATGITGTWCPDMFAARARGSADRDARSGAIGWCPANASLAYVFGDRDGVFLSGEGRATASTALEARYHSGFARLAAGLAVENYAREFPTLGGAASHVLILWSSRVDLSVGVDL